MKGTVRKRGHAAESKLHWSSTVDLKLPPHPSYGYLYLQFPNVSPQYNKCVTKKKSFKTGQIYRKISEFQYKIWPLLKRGGEQEIKQGMFRN